MTQPPGNFPPPPPGGYPPPPNPYGGGYPPPGGGIAPNNNLVWGILVTIFCCVPFGIISIVKASQVSGLWSQGRTADAQKAAGDAKKWAIWGIVAGVIVGVLLAILYVAGALTFYGNVETYEY